MTTLEYNNVLNGITISLTGMAIVFCGLLFISLSLSTLPRVLALFEKLERALTKGKDGSQIQSEAPGASATSQNTVASADDDLAGIIGLVLQLEDQNRLLSSNVAVQTMPN